MTRPVALVTGGTRGIGFGIASALRSRGYDLALSGQRAAAEVAAAVSALTATHEGTVHYVQSDIASATDRGALVDEVLGRFGRVDVLVNNAGRAPRVRTDLLEATTVSFEEIIATNLGGPYFLTQAVARSMIERRRLEPAPRPSIVFITSVSAEMASPHRGEYCISKAGLAMAARLYATRLAAEGIAVFDVRPGVIDTDMTKPVRDVYDRRIADGLVPAGRWGTADDVGAAVAALVAGDVPYATGSILYVDGGLHIPRL
jgi:NAD(P)-dependent dehydrogenase (short-subunit alcohol dehydrogenase family)